MKKRGKKNAKERKRLKKLDGFWSKKVDPRIARKWHKPVQNAILWEKNAKVEDYAEFWAFCRKKHEIFTNPVFKNPGIFIKGKILYE